MGIFNCKISSYTQFFLYKKLQLEEKQNNFVELHVVGIEIFFEMLQNIIFPSTLMYIDI